MPELIDPSEIMFTPFEPKTKNRYIMYIEGKLKASTPGMAGVGGR